MSRFVARTYDEWKTTDTSLDDSGTEPPPCERQFGHCNACGARPREACKWWDDEPEYEYQDREQS